MNLGYARISKADGSQTLDLQIDALTAAGVAQEHLYQDEASGKRDDRPGLEACLKALREGDALYIYGSSIASDGTSSTWSTRSAVSLTAILGCVC